MIIVGAEVKDNHEWANTPDLRVIVDKVPSINDFYFTRKGSLYYAEREDGAVMFYSHNVRNETGYGKRVFTLQMKDGTVKTLKGPWSSNSDCMNRAGFGPCTETWLRGVKDEYWVHGVNLTVKAAQEAMKLVAGNWELVEYKQNHGTYWVPLRTLPSGKATVDGEQVHIVGACKVTGDPVVITAPLADWKRWREGAYVQDAFPTLSAGDREFFITGCSEASFDEITNSEG
jgi:hypothetical protein